MCGIDGFIGILIFDGFIGILIFKEIYSFCIPKSSFKRER
jgi:hypothetical protein